MARKKKIPEFTAQGGGFIDPNSSGSHVWYSINTEGWEDSQSGAIKCSAGGSVTLGDCHRTIKWGFDAYETKDGLKKLAMAIRILTQAHRDYKRALAFAKKHRKPGKKKPATSKKAQATFDPLDFLE